MAFHHCVHGKSWLWLFLLGPAPFAFCFVSLLDGEAHIWLGDLRFALCGSCLFLFCFCCDLPTYMTTSVHVDLILTCFFSCKDRASERYRPHRRKKKNSNTLYCTCCAGRLWSLASPSESASGGALFGPCPFRFLLLSWFVLEVALADFCPTLTASGRSACFTE